MRKRKTFKSKILIGSCSRRRQIQRRMRQKMRLRKHHFIFFEMNEITSD